jgi:hypothetical protein
MRSCGILGAEAPISQVSKLECTNRLSTPLDTVADLAHQADRIGDIIQRFIDRCRGAEGAIPEDCEETPCGHLPKLDLLAKNLSRVEELAHTLNTIG